MTAPAAWFFELDTEPPTTWYAVPGRSTGHLPRFFGGSALSTRCSMLLRRLELFDPKHDGQTCARCLVSADRDRVTVEMPGYPDGTAGGPVEPPHVRHGRGVNA